MKYKKLYLIVFLLICCILFSFKISTNPLDRLTEIAKEYKQYKLFTDTKIIVTDSSRYKWTIVLCYRPKGIEMGWHYKFDSSFISKADKSLSPHGDKLYRLFIKDYDAYLRNAPIGQPVGQVIVKETWNVKEIVYDSLNKKIQQIKSNNDGKWYTPTTVSELFIMYKENESTSNDKGWNYGTYSIENKNEKPLLLNDLKISSCINCHKENKYDRVFGVR
jgi:cytochrome P460